MVRAMRRLGFTWSLSVIALLLGMPALGSADGLPLSKSVQAGKPLHAVKITVEGSDPAVVVVGGKRHEVPLRAPRGASIEAVALAADAAVTVVRVEGANGGWALVLGGRSGTNVLASGKTDWTGDPGERRMFLVEASGPEKSPRTVRFGTRYEGLAQCTANPPLIGAKRVDAITLEALPEQVAFSEVTPEGAAVEVVSGPTRGHPILPALEAVASSRIDETTSFYMVPRPVLDGSGATRWPLARGDFATLRWTQPSVPIGELELDLTLEGASAAGSLLLFADGNRALRIPLPPASPAAAPPEPRSAAPAPNAGELKLRVKPSEPLVTRCLALLSDDLPPGATIAVGEVRAFTELDQPGSIDRLVSLLVQDGQPGANAADLLAAMGDAGALAVAARFDELSPRGKRRGLRVLAKGLEQPPVMARVLNTAREGDADLREQALAVLLSGGEPGRIGLRELALEASEVGDAAARALVQRSGETTTLLQALNTPQGPDRAGLRTSLALSARRDPPGFASAVEGWLGQNPTAPARASLALAASNGGARALALRLTEPAWTGALEFPERYRFANALASADASPEADGWLEQQGAGASEWMMRRAAFESLRARDPARAGKLAENLVSDAYPRVRAAALEALAQGASWPHAAEVTRTDSWPLVRAAGAKALATRPEARPHLEALLSDPSVRVRVAAIDSLAVLKAREAWVAIEPHLAAADESADVHSAAIAFARELCVTQAREPLANTVRRALRPDSGEDAARLGVEALHALHDLGGPATADAKALATRPEAPPGLAKAYQGFRPPACEKAP